MVQKTLSMVKPDGVRKGLVGEVIRRFQSQGLRVAALKMVHLERREAEAFYDVHKDKGFFGELIQCCRRHRCYCIQSCAERKRQRCRRKAEASVQTAAVRSLSGSRDPRF